MTETGRVCAGSSGQTLSDLAEPSRKRRGLVLEGGGAKGAWQFGVLEAFAESGIEFDVVSGTSVGARTARSRCVDRMDKGRKIWTSMALTNVFKMRLMLLPISASRS